MDIKDVENLSELAKLELTEEEKKGILKDMEGILDYVKQIQDVDVPDGVSYFQEVNTWREDVLEERDFSGDIIKKQFPDAHDGFVKVKKIL